MKKSYLQLILLILSINSMTAQVGIGATNPNAQLDIRSSNQATPANNDGVLIPKVDAFSATNPTAAQQGMLVYLTTATTFLATARQPGFYYWNNPTNDWIGISSSANGDHDWYEEGTTTAPNAITDDMFHTGNVAIGKNTADYPLEVSSSAFSRGIVNTFSTSTTNGTPKYSLHNLVTSTQDDLTNGIRTEITNTGDGTTYANYNSVTKSGGNSYLYGSANVLFGNSSGFQYGNYNQITNAGDALQYGTLNTLSNNGNGIKAGNHNFISSDGSGIHYGSSSTLSGAGTGDKYGQSNTISGSGNGDHLGIFNILTGNGIGAKIGVRSQITSTNTAGIYGVNNIINGGSSSINYGIYSTLFGTSTGAQHGSYTEISNSSTGIHYGTLNRITGAGNGLKYGVRNELSGNGNQTGNFNVLTGTGTGLQIGTYNEITTTNASAHTGVLSTMSGTGVGLKTGIYSYILPVAGGTHYGVYSEVLKPGATNFAGYFLGNVGIGTTGGNTYIMPPSRGTNGQIMQTNGTGDVTWQNPGSIAWLTNGNAGTNGGTIIAAGTNFIGTTDNQNIDFRTNNIYRGRFSNLGEFFVGTLSTVLPGDLMNAVGNATFPWASNGYTSFNGGGVYGQVTAGTTAFGAVQGEYNGTGATGTGIRGIYQSATAGTGFNALATGVTGNATSTGTYKFGVSGSGGLTPRSGGVIGYDFGIIGALGYYAFSNIDYSVYGFGQAYFNGIATGRLSNQPMEKNTNIGLGIYGGVMGGWVRGMKYGFHTKGETYSLYVDGNGYTNKPLAYLITTDGASKTASYMSTSMKPEVTVNGKVTLENGKIFVPFDKAFSQIISNIEDVIITASPQGKSNGVYIDQITKEGFWLYENNDGTSNVKISWIAITKIKGEENPEVPSDLLANDFDKKMDGVMFNENNTVDTAQSLWWDGNAIRWDRPTNDKVDTETEKLSRPKEVKK